MSKKTAAGAPQETTLLYDKLVATNAKVERKGATVPHTAANRNMFSYLSKSGEMALRLPTAEREAFLKNIKPDCATPIESFNPSTLWCLHRCSQKLRS